MSDIHRLFHTSEKLNDKISAPSVIASLRISDSQVAKPTAAHKQPGYGSSVDIPMSLLHFTLN